MSAAAPILIGVDCGQTSCKAAAYDVDGSELAIASTPTHVERPAPGRAEDDLGRLWVDVAGAIRDLTGRLADREVLAIGVCGHNDGAYLVDQQFEPVRPGILAIDGRAAELAAELRDRFGSDALRLTGQVPVTASSGSLLAWLDRNEPESLSATRWLLYCKDWVRLQLTGEVATDPTDASASFLDLSSREWSAEALGLFGVEDMAQKLPSILPSAAVAGQVTRQAAQSCGLRAGTTVAVGAHDVDACAIGVGALHTGDASMILGTYSINQVIADRPIVDPRWQARAFVEPGAWLHMSTSAAGAGSAGWFVQHVLGIDRGDVGGAIESAAALPVVESRPMYLPFADGAPIGATAAGGLHGLQTWNTTPDLVRAAIEGVAMVHRYHCDALAEQFDLTRAVRVAGGGARSAGWTQLLADVTGRDLEIPDGHEAGARGAAMLAGVAVGVYSDLADAARCVQVVRTHRPDAAAHAALEARYEHFLRSSGLDSMLDSEARTDR